MSNPQIIEHNGKPTHVVLPIEDYRRLRAQAQDLCDLRAFDDALAGHGESFPDCLAESLVEGMHPVRVFREYRRLSLSELAKRAGLSKSYIAKIESGDGGSLSAYKAIADALDLTVDDLID